MIQEEVRTRAAMAAYRDELRSAIARDLHDGPIQSLIESIVRLERYRGVSTNRVMQSAISDVEESVRIALMSLRHLIRDLRDEPPDDDAAEAIRGMATRFESSTGIEIAVVVSPDWPERLPAGVAVNLIRIVQEAITNAIRHGHAEHLVIEMQRRDGLLITSVADDGCGIEIEAPAGSGLIGMQERAALLGGKLMVRRLDRGTEVRVWVPAP